MSPPEPETTDLPPDPTLDEIRAIRKRISAQFGHDPARLVEHLMTLQQSPELRDRLLKRDPTPIIEKPAA